MSEAGAHACCYVAGAFHLNQPAEARRPEIKVYQLRGEPVALRSIDIRDHIGQRVMGTTQERANYRDTIIRNAYLYLYGTVTPSSGDTLRSAPPTPAASRSWWRGRHTPAWTRYGGGGSWRCTRSTRSACSPVPSAPNPASTRAEITFSVPVRSRVSVGIYAISGGEAVRVVEPGVMEAGRYAVDIDGGQLSPGGYLVRLAYGDRHLVEKLVIVR